jgi:alkanesulfonate monooxygenase SsuD/methylene tetrahydromethanopterin reductase-like flavin-dependent oxidoreductase (luciferase family)
MIAFGITDHLESPREVPSEQVFQRIIAQTELADRLGFEYAWFAEHHAHAHYGHLPAPLLLAIHLAGRTKQIRLGSAIICLNLHHPLAVAEQCATADWLMNQRGAFGFGSGSTPEEFALFNMPVTEEAERHKRFESALRLIQASWRGKIGKEGRPFKVPTHDPLPIAHESLSQRSWVAVNSVGAAKVAGKLNFNILFSHLRTPSQYREYSKTYRAAGGKGLVAINRPVHVARDDASALARAAPALRTLWRRFQAEGKIDPEASESRRPEELCGHPINFLVGGADTVAKGLAELYAECPYDVANLEVRWDGMTEEDIRYCMMRLADEVRPLLEGVGT